MTSFFVFIINFKHIHTLFSVASPDFDKVSMGWEIKRKHVVDLVMFTPTYQETRNKKHKNKHVEMASHIDHKIIENKLDYKKDFKI